MKHLDDLSATATQEVQAPHPEVLQLHETNQHATLEQVQYWWTRFGGNLKKVANILELGRLQPARMMLPGSHHNLAKDRPQGGDSESFILAAVVAAESADRKRPQRIAFALLSTRQRLQEKGVLGRLGDADRLFVLVGGEYEDMMANHS